MKFLLTHKKRSIEGRVSVDTSLVDHEEHVGNVDYARHLAQWYDERLAQFDPLRPNSFTVPQDDGPLTYTVDYAWKVDVLITGVDRLAGVFKARITSWAWDEFVLPIEPLPIWIGLSIEAGSKLSVYTNLSARVEDAVFDEWDMEDRPEWTRLSRFFR